MDNEDIAEDMKVRSTRKPGTEDMIQQSSQVLPETGAKIVAAIPCFNTQPFITDVVLRARACVNQVIVINDGSHDGTAETARAAGALVISHDRNRGYGKAIKSCFEAARANAADVMVVLDGDGQHNPDEIPHVLAPVLKKEADIVIGSRFLSRKNNVPRYRKFGISIINYLYNFGSRTKISDAQSGFRAYSKKAIDGLYIRERGMAVSIEILAKSCKKGFIIAEVPVSCSYPLLKLNMKAIKHGFGVALGVVKLRLIDI
jgi:glycosyltransferase involved in cell wall biosynthesis